LQSKIRVLEEERNTLQTSLKLAQEAKEREEQQHRLLQRQLQLQLQESVKSLTIRHHSETEAIRDVASKSQAELSREVTHLQHRVAEAEVEVQRLRDKSEQVERENTAKDEEVRRLRVSVADLEAAGVALRRVNQKLEMQVAEDEHARRDLVSQNALLEDNIKMLRLAKAKSEESAAQAAQEYAKLEAERIALQREQAMLQGELRHTSDALANKSADMAAAVAQRSGLESEKRQLEESLRNVLTINDQLLQKVYDSSVHSLGAVGGVPGWGDAGVGDMTDVARRIVEEALAGGGRGRGGAGGRYSTSSVSGGKDKTRRSSSASAFEDRDRRGRVAEGAGRAGARQAYNAVSTRTSSAKLLLSQVCNYAVYVHIRCTYAHIRRIPAQTRTYGVQLCRLRT
jgi:chromosome segregation ATPase